VQAWSLQGKNQQQDNVRKSAFPST
jgi:hypothetical protein